MKRKTFLVGSARAALSVLMIVQLGMAQTSIDAELQKKAKLLSPDLARQIALEKEELRAESAELTTQAIRLCDQGKYKEAYFALDEAMKKDPRNTAAKTRLVTVNAILYDTYAGYAMSRIAVADYQGAIDNFRVALEHKQGGEEALKGIQKARALIEETVSKNLGKIISDSMQDEEKVDLLVKQARDLEVQGRYEEAKATYKAAIKIESEDPRPRRLFKELIEKQNRTIADDRRIERRKVMEDLIKEFLQNPEEYVDQPGTETETTVTPVTARRDELIKKARATRVESLNFKDANLQDVVSYITEMSGISIVLNLGDKPANPFTIEMNNATVVDAITYIVESNPGLSCTYDEYAVIISRGEGDMETRFWVISEAGTLSAEEQSSSSSSSRESDGRGGGRGGETDLFRSEPVGAALESAEPGEVAQSPMVKTVNDMLPGLKERGGAVFYEPTSRTLTVRATPGELDRVDELIKDLEKGIKQNQVEIQARFVEMSDQDLEEFSLGLKLQSQFKLFNMNDRQDRAALLNPVDLTGALRRFAKGEQSSRYADRLNKLVALVGTKANQNQIADEVIGFFTSTLTDPEVGLVFHAISEKTNADVLSAPSVTSVSGQSRVRIRQIMEVMYPEDYSVYKPAKIFRAGSGFFDAGGLIDVQQGYATVQGFLTEEVGIELIVSPTISEDGRTVEMEVMTKVSKELEPHIVTAYVGDNTVFPALDPIDLRIPQFKNAEVSTQVVVNDGETIVLGGMITETIREYHDKVPFWGDLPVIGRWFRAEGSFQNKKNLMIFVTVKVITPTGESYGELIDREKREAEKKAAETREPTNTDGTAPAEPAATSSDEPKSDEAAPASGDTPKKDETTSGSDVSKEEGAAVPAGSDSGAKPAGSDADTKPAEGGDSATGTNE